MKNDPFTGRIATFEAVRDIPYNIALAGEPDHSCATKAAALQRRLASLGLGSRFAFGTFRWSRMGLPDELLACLPDDVGWHQWLSVYVPESESWIDLDPSWDSGLAPAFPLATWDGGATSSGVSVPLEHRADDAEVQSMLARGYEPEGVRRYMLAYRPFLAALNGHLSAVRSGAARRRLLFVCIENSNRSQMAEAFARIHGGGRIEAVSSGSRPSGTVNPRAIEFMREVGYDLSAHASKSLTEIPGGRYDAAITMGCGDECPMVDAALREDWAIPDPKHLPPEEFRRIRELIERKVRDLIHRLA